MIQSAKITIAPKKIFKRASFLYHIKCPEESFHNLEDGSEANGARSCSEEVISDHDDDDNGQGDDDPGKQYDVFQTVHPTRGAAAKEFNNGLIQMKKLLWGVSQLALHDDMIMI